MSQTTTVFLLTAHVLKVFLSKKWRNSVQNLPVEYKLLLIENDERANAQSHSLLLYPLI